MEKEVLWVAWLLRPNFLPVTEWNHATYYHISITKPLTVRHSWRERTLAAWGRRRRRIGWTRRRWPSCRRPEGGSCWWRPTSSPSPAALSPSASLWQEPAVQIKWMLDHNWMDYVLKHFTISDNICAIADSGSPPFLSQRPNEEGNLAVLSNIAWVRTLFAAANYTEEGRWEEAREERNKSSAVRRRGRELFMKFENTLQNLLEVNLLNA